jgi:GT2 family glycosyltransferase
VALLSGYKEVDLIKSPENLGFGKANNIGIKKALEEGADYVFLLNQDAWVFENTIENLVNIMQANKKFGILSPLHFSADEVHLDKNLETYMNRATGEDQGVKIVPFVNAAAWMMSRECIESVGYFESLFGHYGEDRNYCDRVAYHKFLIGIDTHSKIIHDRIITRNFNKDLIQSKYKILTTLLNINNGLGKSYVQGLKEVFGLPKYYNRFYRFNISVRLLIKLLSYYTEMVFSVGKIKTARNNAK